MTFTHAMLRPRLAARPLVRAALHDSTHAWHGHCHRQAWSLTQQRKKQPHAIAEPWPLKIAIPDMHSQVNLSRIVRAAALFGFKDLLVSGSGKMDRTISLGAEEHVTIKSVRTLVQPLRKLRANGWLVVGLEQTEASHSLFEYEWPCGPTVLLCGHERHGVSDELLAECDDVVEIPTFGTHLGSHNASTATMMAMYEYVKQRAPEGGDAVAEAAPTS